MFASSLRVLALLAIFFSTAVFAEPYPGKRITPRAPDAPEAAAQPEPAPAQATAPARNKTESEAYFGIELGQASPEDSGFKDDNSFRLTIGTKSNQNFGLEFSYLSLGEFDAKDDLKQLLSFLIGDTVTGASVSISGFEFAFKGLMPVTDKLGFYGRAGFFLWDSDIDIQTQNLGSASDSDSGTDLSIGLGAEYKINEAATLKAGYSKVTALEDDTTTVSVGINFKI